jgi:hypothetical protein
MKSVMRTVLVGGLAVLAFGAVTAAGASAFTNPILVNSKGEHVSKVKFTGEYEQTEENFPVAMGEEVKGLCEGEKSTGELSTTGTGTAAATSGTATYTFTKCKMPSFGGCYNNEQIEKKQVEVKYSLSLVWLGKESEEKPGIRAWISPLSEKPGNGKGGKVDVSCSGLPSIEAEGAFVGRLSRKLGEESTLDRFYAHQSGAKQEYKKYTEEGKEAESNLWASDIGESKFFEAVAQISEEQTYGEKVKIAKS